MKTFTTVLLLCLCIACSKQNLEKASQPVNANANVAYVAEKDLPLNDLGTNLFRGYAGGLYPNGANTASGTYANDLMTVSKSIVAIDTFGNPSTSRQGQILFISLGGSTGSNNMKALKAKTTGNPQTNIRLHLMNCNQAAQKASLNSITDVKDPYWLHISDVIHKNGGSFRQVQLIYLETDDSSTMRDFPQRPIIVKNSIEACLRTLKAQFPNLKIVYVLARTKTFGNNTAWNAEPSPYFFGWACKWAIEDQMNGVAGTQYKGANAVAPMLAWGFYQWATDTPRRTDGFSWIQSETKDNLHANDVGQDSLSTRFQNFLLTDPYAKTWYAR